MEFDEWQFATDGTSTLITHRKPGEQPDALVYVEACSPAAELFPSYEIGRFQFTADPGLSPNIVYPPLALLGREWAQKQTIPPLDVLLALQLATTRTTGMGLGYSSTEGTFTGWKWVGQGAQELELRFGRTSGRWDAPALPGMRQIEAILGQLAEEVLALRLLTEHIDQTQALGRATRRAPSAAWMILGSASRRSNPVMGVHIAILCERQPVCPVSRELAAMLRSLRPMSEGAQIAAPAGPLLPFARELGVNLLSPSELISPPQMIALLQRALKDAEQEGDASGAPLELPEGGEIPGAEPAPTEVEPGESIPIPSPEAPAPAGEPPSAAPASGGGAPTVPETPPAAEPGQPIPIPE